MRGNGEEEMQLEKQQERLIVVDVLDAFDEAFDRSDELVGVEVVDREVELPLQEDPLLRLHQ